MTWLELIAFACLYLPLGLMVRALCCCGSCAICVTTACGWTADSGSWIDTAGTFTTTNVNAFYRSTTTQPAGSSALGITLGMQSTADGDLLRVITAYQDASNYWFAELKIDSSAAGTFELYQRSGGVDTLQGSLTGLATPASTLHVVSLCVDELGSGIIAKINGALLAFVAPITGNGFAVGTGATLTGTASFSSVTVARTDEQCPACVTCSTPNATNTADVTCAKVLQLEVYTTDADHVAFLGLYLVGLDPVSPVPFGHACQYTFYADDPSDLFGLLDLQINGPGVSSYLTITANMNPAFVTGGGVTSDYWTCTTVSTPGLLGEWCASATSEVLIDVGPFARSMDFKLTSPAP